MNEHKPHPLQYYAEVTEFKHPNQILNIHGYASEAHAPERVRFTFPWRTHSLTELKDSLLVMSGRSPAMPVEVWAQDGFTNRTYKCVLNDLNKLDAQIEADRLADRAEYEGLHIEVKEGKDQ